MLTAIAEKLFPVWPFKLWKSSRIKRFSVALQISIIGKPNILVLNPVSHVTLGKVVVRRIVNLEKEYPIIFHVPINCLEVVPVLGWANVLKHLYGNNPIKFLFGVEGTVVHKKDFHCESPTEVRAIVKPSLGERDPSYLYTKILCKVLRQSSPATSYVFSCKTSILNSQQPFLILQNIRKLRTNVMNGHSRLQLEFPSKQGPFSQLPPLPM